MKKEKALYIVIAILVITNAITALGYHFSMESEKKSQAEVEEKIKKYLELLNPNSKIEISAITEEAGLYKVIFKINNVFSEVYVTKDSNYLIQNPIPVNKAIEELSKRKSFIECLKSKGVKFYGILNCSFCQMQRQILGIYYYEIYVPCDIYPSVCAAKNITAVPAFEINGTIKYGILTLSELSKLTGCSLE